MIPKSFQLVNRKYTVRGLGTETAEAANMHGDCNSDEAVIRVRQTKNRQLMEHTYFHELAHALLYVTTKPRRSLDEEFVESLGAALHQYMLTKKGEFK